MSASPPARPPLARAARWDGLLPGLYDKAAGHFATPKPEQLAALVAEARALRGPAADDAAPYDVVIEADSSREFVQLDPPDPASWAAAGATWWVESWWTIERGAAGLAETSRRITAGPPR